MSLLLTSTANRRRPSVRMPSARRVRRSAKACSALLGWCTSTAIFSSKVDSCPRANGRRTRIAPYRTGHVLGNSPSPMALSQSRARNKDLPLHTNIAGIAEMVQAGSHGRCRCFVRNRFKRRRRVGIPLDESRTPARHYTGSGRQRRKGGQRERELGERRHPRAGGHPTRWVPEERGTVAPGPVAIQQAPVRGGTPWISCPT